MKKLYAIVILLALGITQTQIYAQCYQCTGTAFKIGTGTIATGNNSFAGGYNSGTSTENSFVFGNASMVYGLRGIALGNLTEVSQNDGIAIGSNALSDALNGYVFGKDVKGTGNNSITIGLGTSSSSLLSNSKANSIMFGVTHKPSLTIVQPAAGADMGYLGINTTNPQQKLHINEGNLLIASTNSGNSNAPTGALLFANPNDAMCSSGQWGIEFINSNNPTYGGNGLNFRKYCGKTSTQVVLSALFLSDNYNVGIGTKDPQAKLDVVGDFKAESANISGNISISNISTTELEQNAMVFGVPPGGFQPFPAPSKWGIERVKLGQEYGLNFWRYDFGNLFGGIAGFNSVMFFDDRDNVGIGTESPQARLDIAGDFRAENAEINGTLTVENLSLTGNFGLGTNSPQEKLHVKGGNILLTNTSNPTNGLDRSALIFDIVQSDPPAASPIKWGIEYCNSRTDGYGLNFWQYFSSGGNSDDRGYNSVMFLDHNFNVGIGTKTPATKLDVAGAFKSTSANISGTLTADVLTSNSATINGLLKANSATITGLLKAKNAIIDENLEAVSANITTLTAETLNISSITLDNLFVDELTAQTATVTGISNLIGNVTVGTTSQPAQLNVVNGAVNAKSATINGDTYISGKLGIGINPVSKLDVKGTIRAEEVKVCVNQGCDFVFEEDYELMSLNDLNNFIKTNKHLPNVAPAAKMEAEGINLSEMNATLLQKVEELTLYILDLQKQINELKKQ